MDGINQRSVLDAKPRWLSCAIPEAVHVWLIPVQYGREHDRHCLSWLDADELERAQRFHFARDRALFVESHLWLRRLLAQTSERSPESLRFQRLPGQKPRLVQAADAVPIEFSLSHTHRYAAVAVARQCPIGVDVERIRPIEQEEIGRLVWHPVERAWMQTLAPMERRVAFYRLWTAKEAYIKARGSGLSTPLDRLCVNVVDARRHVIVDPARRAPIHDVGHCSLVVNEGSPAIAQYMVSVTILRHGASLVVHQVPAGTRASDPLGGISPQYM